MNYLQWTFPEKASPAREVLLARLSQLGFEGFEETPEALLAYAPEDAPFLEEARRELGEEGIALIEQTLAGRNWNAEWEASFTPVALPGLCHIRAAFHAPPGEKYPYELIITPQMSFGTGHHETTRLMMAEMAKCAFKGRQVLDFGAGTGVLAILACKMGAAETDAVENDPGAAENARENLSVNDCPEVRVFTGSLEQVAGRRYEVILANINRNILLQNLPELKRLLAPEGALLMSGLLREDGPLLTAEAARHGLEQMAATGEGNWLMLRFQAKAIRPMPTEAA